MMRLKILIALILHIFLVACTASGGVYHKVLAGQTLYSISKSYQIDESYLARINGINDPTLLKIGQQLYIPGAENERRVPITLPSSNPLSERSIQDRQALSPPVAPARSAEPPRAIPAKPSPATPPQAKNPPDQRPGAHQGRFIWPMKGKVLRRFGSRTDGALCKGLEISATSGSAVTSAAAGKVIYSGNGISGFGNLIIVRHDDSYFTVYGFNQKNLVTSGAFVSKGQKIALAGVPPKGGTARLYFEIRYGKEPVDPIFYLP